MRRHLRAVRKPQCACFQEVAYKDLYSYSVDDYNVMTVMEGCSICTLSDVTEETQRICSEKPVFGNARNKS